MDVWNKGKRDSGTYANEGKGDGDVLETYTEASLCVYLCLFVARLALFGGPWENIGDHCSECEMPQRESNHSLTISHMSRLLPYLSLLSS